MIGWTILNVLSAIVVASIVAFKLGAYPEYFTLGERLGMGAIAAGMLMRIAPIVGKNLLGTASPFDDWSVLLLHTGLATYFIARLLRVHRHWRGGGDPARDDPRHLGGIGR